MLFKYILVDSTIFGEARVARYLVFCLL